MKKLKESDLYPIVERRTKKHFSCFKTAINQWIKYSRIDVIGVRDVGWNLSWDIELVSIEVKRWSEPFATASWQASGYKVYAHRIYLADYREDEFSLIERDIASHLWIWLIQIDKNFHCKEILSSPLYKPLKSLNLLLLEKLELVRCQLCWTFWNYSYNNKNTSRNIKNAKLDEKWYLFWSSELADRKRKIHYKDQNGDTTFERRYLCSECVQQFFKN